MRTIVHYTKKHDIRVESKYDDILIISEPNLESVNYIRIDFDNFNETEEQEEKSHIPKLPAFNHSKSGCE